MPFSSGMDRYYDKLYDKFLESHEDNYEVGYNAGYDNGQNAGFKEGLRTGESRGALDEATRIAHRLRKLNIITLEQISEVTGLKVEDII